MPYDYPGEYAQRFDGIDAALFRGIGNYVGKAPGVPVPLGVSGPGTLVLYHVTSTGSRGTRILQSWRGTSTDAGRPRDFQIVRRDTQGRWSVRGARITGWTTGTARATSNEVLVEKLTIAYEHIEPA